jgi:hypothetical protein
MSWRRPPSSGWTGISIKSSCRCATVARDTVKTDRQRNFATAKPIKLHPIGWVFPIVRNCQIGKSGRSFTSFSRIQNPRPVRECYINPFLAKSRAKLNRKFIQHRLDCLVGQVAEIGVDGFASE